MNGSKIWRLVKDDEPKYNVDWNFDNNTFIVDKDIKVDNEVFQKNQPYLIPGDWKYLFHTLKKKAKNFNVKGVPNIEGECLDGLID